MGPEKFQSNPGKVDWEAFKANAKKVETPDVPEDKARSRAGLPEAGRIGNKTKKGGGKPAGVAKTPPMRIT